MTILEEFNTQLVEMKEFYTEINDNRQKCFDEVKDRIKNDTTSYNTDSVDTSQEKI